jgi:hypothetical protein
MCDIIIPVLHLKYIHTHLNKRFNFIKSCALCKRLIHDLNCRPHEGIQLIFKTLTDIANI